MKTMFYLVGAETSYLFGYWPYNSVGDIIDILLQMLEVSFNLNMPSISIFIYLLYTLRDRHGFPFRYIDRMKSPDNSS